MNSSEDQSKGMSLDSDSDTNLDGFPRELSLHGLADPEAYQEADAIAGFLREAVNSAVFAESFALQLSRNPEIIKWQLKAKLDRKPFKRALKLDPADQAELVREELDTQVALITERVVAEFNKDLDNPHSAIRGSLAGDGAQNANLKRLDRKIPEGTPPRQKAEMREDIMVANSVLEPMRRRFRLRDTLTGFLRTALRRSLGLAIYNLTNAEGTRLVPQDDRQDMYAAAFLMFDDLFEDTEEKSAGRAKMELLDELVGLPLDFVGEVSAIVDKPLSINVATAVEDEYRWFGDRARRNMLEFLNLHRSELTENPDSREHFKKALDIYYEMLSNPELELYLVEEASTDLALLERIFEACRNDRVCLNAIFCPDWSGIVTAEGLFKYTFEDVGEEVGTVAKKGMPILVHLHRVFSNHLSNVEVRLDYPTFECPLDGYKDDRTGNFIAREEFARRLGKSGQKAQRMMEEMGISMTPGTTSRLFEDESMFADKDRMLKALQEGILPEGFTQESWDALLEKTYEARKNFYPRWYPMNPGETDGDYRARLMSEIIPLQLFEYCIFQAHYRNQPGNLLVMADNSFMSTTIAGVTGCPVFAGHGKDSQGYVGQ